MGAAKPCLGYASRTAAVHGLRSNGMTTRQIAEAIGIEYKTVLALEAGSSRPRRIPRPTEERGRAVVIPVDVLNALYPHAARRNMSTNHMVRLLISTVVDEGMIDAVMDDADSLGEWA